MEFVHFTSCDILVILKNKALRWCRHGAELGSASLQHRLAMHLLVGENCTKNQSQALVWLRRAAEQGYAAAQNNLGVVLAAGQQKKHTHTQKDNVFFGADLRICYVI